MIKRLFDFVAAGAVLLLLSPLIVVVSIMVWLKLGRPIFFTQIRPGRAGRPFRMIKFRSMRNANDAHGQPLSDAKRLTRFGQVLRNSSLDELPELWNVLRGDMSLVGPRPLLVEYLPLYDTNQRRRHEVRPGVTGWAQVNGRNALSWTKKFELDVWYVDHQTLSLDVRILWLTMGKVIKRDGISAEGHVTMEPFTGNTK
jgi:lipopolysaccharide/colanic/teichoic acid biosynthesis glycosyltransferase